MRLLRLRICLSTPSRTRPASAEVPAAPVLRHASGFTVGAGRWRSVPAPARWSAIKHGGRVLRCLLRNRPPLARPTGSMCLRIAGEPREAASQRGRLRLEQANVCCNRHLRGGGLRPGLCGAPGAARSQAGQSGSSRSALQGEAFVRRHARLDRAGHVRPGMVQHGAPVRGVVDGRYRAAHRVVDDARAADHG